MANPKFGNSVRLMTDDLRHLISGGTNVHGKRKRSEDCFSSDDNKDDFNYRTVINFINPHARSERSLICHWQ
jgi:hypothetical protein